MSRSGRQRSIIMCRNKPCEHGAIKTKSNSSRSLADNEDIKSEAMETHKPPTQPETIRTKRSISATAESPRMAKKKISNDKSSICSENIQGGSSTQTSDRVSIGKDTDLKPFFDDACSEMSERLRWHTRIDLHGLGTNSSTSSWHNVESNCCVNMKKLTNPKKPNSSMTSSASSPSSVRAFMADGTTTRIRKVILRPSKEVAMKLRRWMGCCRWTYNAALAYTQRDVYHKKTFYWLRNRFVNECNIPPSQSFLLDTPKHVREGAIKDLSQAFKINFQVRKKNPSHTFSVKFRKKNDDQSIVIPKNAFKQRENGVALYPTMLSNEPLISFIPTYDCRLSMDRQKRFVLHVPVDVQKFKPIHETQVNDIVSLDPGVRTFLTSWSPNGEAYKLGDENATQFYEHLVRIDKLVSSVSKAKGRSKYRKNARLQALRDRVKNIQRDLHYQCAHFLVSRYDTLIIPVFGSKQMSSKLNRRLRTKTVRSMLGLGHYAFRQRLKEVAERRNVQILECTEEYTSKTCSCCGWIHPRLGGSKMFTCGHCGAKVDRDLQGAFNIFLKYVTTHPGVFSG